MRIYDYGGGVGMEMNVEGKSKRRRSNQRWINRIDTDTKKGGICKDEVENRNYRIKDC